MDLPFLSEYDPPGSSEGSLDPLGLYMLADQLAVELVPAVRERMQRIRFLTAIAVGSMVSYASRGWSQGPGRLFRGPSATGIPERPLVPILVPLPAFWTGRTGACRESPGAIRIGVPSWGRGERMVGAARFELATYCSQSSRATRLRYAPTRRGYHRLVTRGSLQYPADPCLQRSPRQRKRSDLRARRHRV